MVAQMLLGHPSDRRFLRGGTAAARASLPRAAERSRATTSAVARSLPSSSRSGAQSPASCRASATRSASSTRRRCPADKASLPSTARELAPWCGFGYSAAHSRFYWGMRARALVRPRRLRSATSTSFPPTHPSARPCSNCSSGSRSAGQLVIADKGFAGADFEEAVARAAAPSSCGPSRADEPERP